MMYLHRFDGDAAAASAFSDELVARIRKKPESVLGLATGSTMEPVYRHLVAAYRRGDVSFAGVTSFNLDEYIGLGAADAQSYAATMRRLLFDHVDIRPEHCHLPDGMAGDVDVEASRYEQAIAQAGGIDVQILGIGRNGHIGFNEPGSSFSGLTHPIALHQSTLAANARFFAGKTPPQRAITMGIATILKAKSIMVLAMGAAKQEAVTRAVMAPACENCPASALQQHGDTQWWLDAQATPATAGGSIPR